MISNIVSIKASCSVQQKEIRYLRGIKKINTIYSQSTYFKDETVSRKQALLKDTLYLIKRGKYLYNIEKNYCTV